MKANFRYLVRHPTAGPCAAGGIFEPGPRTLFPGILSEEVHGAGVPANPSQFLDTECYGPPQAGVASPAGATTATSTPSASSGLERRSDKGETTVAPPRTSGPALESTGRGAAGPSQAGGQQRGKSEPAREA